MSSFRKKPVEVEAWYTENLLWDARDNWGNLPEVIRLAYDDGKILFLPDAILISTLEGTMRAERTDWVIQGVQGELYPCKPDIFARTYERG